MSVQTFALASGSQIPALGLGTWKLDADLLPELIPTAVELGYRHFDCAATYGNEKKVGEGLANALERGLCTREELWITSKLWNTDHHPDHVRAACEHSLSDLRLDYLDLYHIHFPIALQHVPHEQHYPLAWPHPETDPPQMRPAAVPVAETWGAMEELHEAGLAREIGVCNFASAILQDLIHGARIKPAALQIELHPELAQPRMLRLASESGIHVSAYSPFGVGSYQQLGLHEDAVSLLEEDRVTSIAEELGKSPAQVLLRWAVQRGTSVIPKASSREHLAANLDVFDFELEAGQLERLGSLDHHCRYNDPGLFTDQAFGCFYPIYD